MLLQRAFMMTKNTTTKSPTTNLQKNNLSVKKISKNKFMPFVIKKPHYQRNGTPNCYKITTIKSTRKKKLQLITPIYTLRSPKRNCNLIRAISPLSYKVLTTLNSKSSSNNEKNKNKIPNHALHILELINPFKCQEN